MSEMKRCKQCGVLKDVNAFRQYTYSKSKGTGGRFRICKQCESLNTTYRRLLAEKEKHWNAASGHYTYSLTEEGYWHKLCDDLKQIEDLYRLLEAHGHTVPKVVSQRPSQEGVMSAQTLGYVEQLSGFYGIRTGESKESPRPVAVALEPDEMTIPGDLKKWLDMSNEDYSTWIEFGFTPDYLQDVVYEALKAKYRPQTSTDPVTFLPIYDDTYKSVLNKILRSFDDYEDFYAAQEGEANGDT